MSIVIRAVALTAAALSLTACATVTRGTSTDWKVASTPPGAKVTTSNGYSCASTPCAIKMPRKSQFTATVSMDGYKDGKIIVTNSVSKGGGTAAVGNVLIGGLIGVGVDATSGAMLDLHPNPAEITLEKLDAVASK